jgi:hypothetical protein
MLVLLPCVGLFYRRKKMVRHKIFGVFFLCAFCIAFTGCKTNESQDECYFFPAESIEMQELMHAQSNAEELKEFELELRKNIADGWEPTWQSLAPDLTREDCMKMPTSDLAEVCFSSSVITRALLIYNYPAYAFVRLKVFYPCYEELFKREDLYDGIIEAYSMYSSALDRKAHANTNVDSMMGLENLPYMFQIPQVKEQMKGNELVFIGAQLEALKKIRLYIDEDTDDALESSTPYFSLRTPISLVNNALLTMREISPNDPANDAIKSLQLPVKPNCGQVKKYIDDSITQIERFFASQHKLN